MGSIRRTGTVSMLALFTATVGTAVSIAQPVEIASFQMAEQPVNIALQQLSKKFDVQIASFSEDVSGKTAGQLSGSYTLPEALSVVLRGSGLRYARVDDRTIAVGSLGRLEERYSAAGYKTIGYNTAANYKESLSTYSDDSNASLEEDFAFEEVVVTGSRIKRDANLAGAAPVATISNEDFRMSGEVNIAEVLNDDPALLTSVTAENSFLSSFVSGYGVSTAVGQSVLQLRGLGVERTLVLVNGRRHVSGVLGTQSVDIGSIPSALIERVETLTGGASSVYGADAVTGVVNFVLKDDFEGIAADAQVGISEEGDSERFKVSVLYGQNFDDDRGNFTIGVDYSGSGGMQRGDRDFTRDGGIANPTFANPDLRFQRGEITAASTPNFAQFYDTAQTGRFQYGFSIPSVDSFIAAYSAEFGAAPALTEAELALIDRAASAPPRVVATQSVFSVTSNGGTIAPRNFSSPDLDLNNNGVSDCLDSFVGYNSTFTYPYTFGAAGGCFVNTANGVKTLEDGLIVGNFQNIGGDGYLPSTNHATIIPEDEKFSINFSGNYKLTEDVRLFAEAKYVNQKTEYQPGTTFFTDLLTIAPDNPFIPTELQALATSAGGLFMTIDPYFRQAIDNNERETFRIVGGIDGEFSNGWSFELSANYGKFQQTTTDNDSAMMDRFFAAIDVVDDGNGNAICRSDIDPTAPPTTRFGIPDGDPGFFTFNPGDGSCKPLNLFGIASGDINQEALDFFLTSAEARFKQEQFVLSGFVGGDTADWLELPGGPVRFVFGGEYRRESSSSDFDPLALGIAPVTTDFINAGESVGGNPNYAQESLLNGGTYTSGARVLNAAGDYDVYELFGEVELPILSGVTMAEELRINASVRYSDYSTIGPTFVWSVGGVWAPVEDLTIRGSVSRSVRAPNITELFSPAQAGFFFPQDPCDQDQIDGLKAAGDARGAVREANCRADGLPEGYLNPLSSRFAGEISGNEGLQEEKADTFTIGAILRPRMIEGLSLTVDYWNIEINDAIALVSDQDIVNRCYDSSDFPHNAYCDNFTRNRDTGSAQYGGFTFLRQTYINFAKLEAAGVDMSAAYAFSIDKNNFNVRLSGTWFDKVNNFFDPNDFTLVDPELGEIQRPEWAGNLSVQWHRGPLSVGWRTNYQSEQAYSRIEIETATQLYGEGNGIGDETFIHDLNFSYDFSETVSFYGGINNVTNEKPYITESAIPVSARGRSYFMGVSANF